VGDETFLLSPTAFFQTNVGAADALTRLVLAHVPARAHRVLDLYSGCGLFAQPLARRGLEVVAVDENAQAIADGVASREAAGLSADRYRFVRARVERFLHRDRAAMQALREDVDVVVVDPPREGCPAGVLEAVMDQVHPSVLVYVSCAPESLARDIGRARRAAAVPYVIEHVQPIDMFPHTPHVETVVVMRRATRSAPGPARRRVPRA
jgi:23S rRNA (uracil1939-C5)-methyltransferase